MQIVCTSGEGWGVRDAEESAREASERDAAFHAGSHVRGDQVCRTAGQEETTTTAAASIPATQQ